MKFNEVHVSEYLKAHDLGDGDCPVTIESWELFEESGVGKYPERSIVVRFREFPGKKLSINKVNGDTICGICGDDTDDWVGKRITLYATEVQNPQGKTVMGIRVRLKAPPPVSGSSAQSGAGRGGVVQTFGEVGSNKLMARLTGGVLTANNLRAVLASRGKPLDVVNDGVANWPAAWGKEIAEWLANPVLPSVGTHEPLDVDSLPF